MSALLDGVRAVYADGGLIRSNPSIWGGTWATCHVGQDDERVWTSSGIILPARWNDYKVENNQLEFFALLQGIQSLPDGWSGWAYSDNQNTIRRFSTPHTASFNGIPKPWVARLKEERKRLGEVRFTQLKGHPNKKAIAASAKARMPVEVDGRLVSHHNVWCDKECGRLAADWWKEHSRLNKAEGA